MTHCIRLRGAWEVTAAGGRTRHTRRFGWPSPLDAGERVWLVCGPPPAAVEVLVNGERVGTAGAGRPFAADVTPLLAPRNEVAFEGTSTDPPGDVALEIRPDPSSLPPGDVPPESISS